MDFISLGVRPSLSILLASSNFPWLMTKSRSFWTTWVRAIRAIMAGSMSMPNLRVSIPKENRVTPVMASMPMEAMKMPSRPDSTPLGRLSPLTPAIREMPRIAMEKYSTDAKLDTSLVMKDAHTSSRIADISPPKVEANREVSRAFLTFPCLARG